MSARRLGDVLAVHAVAAGLVGLGWYALAPRLTYTVVGGTAALFDETRYSQVFWGDGTFAVLGLLAGVACAVVLLLRGQTGVGLPVGVAVGGVVGSLAAWWLAVQLGPGRLDALAAAVGDGEVRAGPELLAPGVMVVWPVAALTVVLVATAFGVSGSTRRRPARPSAG